jgi:GT2 family glycosyltransferase
LKPLISVIIPSYKSQEYIYKNLDSIINQNTHIAYEIIVVDSTPGNLHSNIRRKYPSIKVIHSSKPVYPGQARNIGINNSKGKVLLFMDADTTVEAGFIEKLMTEMESHDVVSVAIDVANRTNMNGWAQYLFEFNEFIPERPSGYRDSLASYCIAVKREIFERLGCFDSKRICAEDFMLSAKFIKNKIRLYFCNRIRISHYNKKSIYSILKTQFYLGRGGMLVRRNYKMRGDSIVKFPLLIPLACIYKYISMLLKLFKFSKKKFLLYVLLTPHIIIQHIAYMYGMFKGRIEDNPLGQKNNENNGFNVKDLVLEQQ